MLQKKKGTAKKCHGVAVEPGKIFENKRLYPPWTGCRKKFGRIPTDELEGLLQDMVRNNILYFDPTEAVYYPQGKSYLWGIRLYFEH